MWTQRDWPRGRLTRLVGNSMVEALVQFFSSWPTPLATAALAALPVTELRLAIPIAMHVWSLAPFDALLYAFLGNLLPIVPLYFGLMKLRDVCEKRLPRFVRPIDAMLGRGERKLKSQYARYGAFALFLFTAIPLPLTGVWSATVAAVALKIPFKSAVLGIAFGALAAGVIVTVLSITADVVLQ